MQSGLKEFFEKAQHTDSIVLTPNRRLVQFLQNQFDLYQLSKGSKAWNSYPSFFINDWLQTLWQRLQLYEPASILMTKSQELAIWTRVIKTTNNSDQLFNPQATAEVARKAWYSLCQWRLTKTVVDNSDFNQWLEKYLAFCARKRLIDLPSAIDASSEALAQGQYVLPKQLYLFAFDDINPQLQHLIAVIKARGVQVEKVDIQLSESAVDRVFLDDGDAELAAAAAWAAEIVNRQPQASVGIVIPMLSQQRDKVERIFNQVFEPQQLLPHSARHANGFNLSAGMPLSSTSPVVAALSALELNFHKLTIGQVSQLLLSPFIGIVDELPVRAVLDVQLRAEYLELSVNDLCMVLVEFGQQFGAENPIADLHRRLCNFQHLSISHTKPSKNLNQSPSRWAQLFSQQLDALGWPGNRSPDTIEFQQLELWQKVLLQLASFDVVFSDIGLTHAMALLRRLAFDTHFQPQTGDSPVQLLGLFEAAGMLFDYLWVMHLDSESWPPPINPNPLLPLALQKSKQMPMSSALRELTLARQLTRRLQYSASQVIFSHSVRDGDTVLNPSPLIESVPTIPITQLPCYQTVNYWQTVAVNSELEHFNDDYGSPLDTATAMAGGVQILKNQAACPFRAFATHRLRAKPIVTVQPGLSAAERGNLVHSALDSIWRHLSNHAALIQLSDDALQRLIRQSVNRSFQVINSGKTNTGRTIGPKLKQLETDRLCGLLQTWMELEKQRAPFSIKSTEVKTSFILSQLLIHIRYDRIDQLVDGSLLVIDYKTSNTDIRDWTGSRPNEPQVPLYAIAGHRQPVSAVAFGQLNVDQVAFKGISHRPDTASGLQSPTTLGNLVLPSDWQAILAHWRVVLSALADEFTTGYAEVKPKYNGSTCRYCSLHNFCRVKQFSDK